MYLWCQPCGSLPLTYTVTASDMVCEDRGACCKLVITSCFGSGATAIITTTGGDNPDCPGPITGVEVTDGGRCYAIIGRVAPTLSATIQPGPESIAAGTAGSGATLTVSTTESQDFCGRSHWYVSSVSISGGTGYLAGDTIRISRSVGDTAIVEAEASLTVTDGVPTAASVLVAGEYYRESLAAPATVSSVSVSPSFACAGFGAAISATVDDDPTSSTFGQITGLTIDSGGDNYVARQPGGHCYEKLNGVPIVVQATNQIRGGVLCAVACRVLPCPRSGYEESYCNAVVVVRLPNSYNGEPVPIENVDVNYGGAEYAVIGRVQPSATISAEEPGAGAAFAITWEEEEGRCGLPYWRIASVAVTAGGSGYEDGQSLTVATSTEDDIEDSPATLTVVTTGESGEVAEVTVASGGRYWRTSTAIPGIALPVEITLSQLPPSNGSGAVLEPVIDTDPDSPTFGQITAVTVVSQGSNYRLLVGGPEGEYEATCDGLTVTLTLSGCERSSTLKIKDAEFDGPASSCPGDTLEFTLVRGVDSGSAEAEPGGVYEGVPAEVCECCADDCDPQTITITVTVGGETRTVTFTTPTPGTGDGFFDLGDDNYIYIGGVVNCSSCGYRIDVSVCAVIGELVVQESHFGTAAFNEDYCLADGSVSMQCAGLCDDQECVATVTVTVS